MKKLNSSLALGLGLLATVPAHANTAKPNIVYFICDDLGFGEIQGLNPERGKIPTPNVDRLMGQGMTFTDAHGASAVCTPTRYGLMTGRYPWRTRLQHAVVQADTDSLIATDRLTIGQLLQEQGYHTAMFGKWHLGVRYHEDTPGPGMNVRGPDAARVGFRVEGSPSSHGFNYFYGFHHSGSMETVIENDRVVDSYPTVQMLPELTRRSVAYIHERAEAAKAGQPFFLYFPINSPHAPVVPTPRFKGKSGLNDHGDFVMDTDWAFGEVVKALDEAGLADNTLVIFTSDNGTSYPDARIGVLQSKGHFPSGPYRGYKSDLWDGGHRIPFIVRWPGVVEPGSQTDHLTSLNDFMATLAELFDVTLPPNAGEDSVSILPLLRGEDKPVREYMIHHSFHGRFAIRSAEWKYVLAPGSGGWTDVDARAAERGMPPVQLYNMVKDFREQNNLESKHPEVVAAMHAELERIVAAGRSTPGPRQPNDVNRIDLWKKNW